MASRKLEVAIVGDSKSLSRAFAGSARDAKRFQAQINGVSSGIGRAFAATGIGLGVGAVIAGAKRAVDAASDVGEEVNKTNVVFGRSARVIQAWSKSTAKSLGISRRGALEAAGGFGVMLRTAGLTQGRAAAFSKRLVALASDLASFNNIDPSDALDKLRSGLAGEAEPLRRLGVLLSESRVQQQAYASGVAKVGAKLTEQQKVLARYALILKDTAVAQGDFARTSTSQANQERINAALREQFAANIGRVLLPAVNAATRAVNAWLSSEKNLAAVQRLVERGLKLATSAARAFADIARTIAPILQRTASALGGTEKAIKLLLAAMVASKILSFTGALTGLSAQALTTTGRVTALRGALLRLGALGVITLGVAIALNREQIHRAVAGFLRRHKLGFLAGTQIEIPVDVNLGQLAAARDRLAEIKGEGSLLVSTLDKAIARLRVLDRQNLRRVEGSFKRFRQTIARLPDRKQVDVNATLKGIRRVQDDLAKVRDKTVNVRTLEKGLADIVSRLAGVRDKTVAVSFIETGLDAIRAKLTGLSGKPVPIAVDIVEGRRGSRRFEGTSAVEALENMQQAIEGAIARLRAAVKRGKVATRRAFDELMETLDRAEIRAGGTETESDNLRVLKQKLTAVQAQLGVEGRTKELLDLEAELSADIAVTQRQIAQNAAAEAASARARARAAKEAARERQRAALAQAAANRKATQFRALGLTATGEQRVPSTAALGKRLATLREQVKGTVLDTSKTRSQLQQIAKVLSGQFGAVGREVRQAILAMFRDISGALEGGQKGTSQTKFVKRGAGQILSGLGLSPQEIKALRQRLAQLGPGGTAPGKGVGAFGFAVPVPAGAGAGGAPTIDLHATLVVDGRELTAVVTRQQQKQRGRQGPSRRGAHAGI